MMSTTWGRSDSEVSEEDWLRLNEFARHWWPPDDFGGSASFDEIKAHCEKLENQLFEVVDTLRRDRQFDLLDPKPWLLTRDDLFEEPLTYDAVALYISMTEIWYDIEERDLHGPLRLEECMTPDEVERMAQYDEEKVEDVETVFQEYDIDRSDLFEDPDSHGW